MVPPDYLPSADQGEEVLCLHHYELDIPAPGLLAWGWTGGGTAAWGYPGPSPWFALATLFHTEARVGAGQHDCLSPYLFEMYVRACRAYAGSLRQGLQSTRLDEAISIQNSPPLRARRVAHREEGKGTISCVCSGKPTDTGSWRSRS